MKLDEFAFFNQQLAAMLRAGIPLEGALRQLSASMRRGSLRNELQQVEARLRQGVPLKETLADSGLPGFYIQMINVGMAANDLPGVLTLVADYYQRVNALWTRLKGLMVYPLIVLGACLLLSGWLTFFVHQMGRTFFEDLLGGTGIPPQVLVTLWVPFICLVLLAAVVVIGLMFRRCRLALQWWLPGFREASLARVAAAVAVMLRGGCALPEAVGLVARMEAGSPAATALAAWQQWLAAGGSQLPAATPTSRVFPPLFLWLVGSAGEEVAEGFQSAADIYGARAAHRAEMMLFAALPVAVLALGALVLSQLTAVLLPLLRVMSALGG
jgi:general secretion pathway protein F